jgi:hypothetical protein
MAIPSYAYLKLKIPGHASVITVEAKTQWALDCEQNNIELAAATVVVGELRGMCLWVPPNFVRPAMPNSSSAFKVAENAKAVQIDTKDPAKTVQIGPT